MYKDIFKVKSINIKQAPHWRLLDKFGGPLSIQDFRKSFNSIQYNDIDDYIMRAPPSRMIENFTRKRLNFKFKKTLINLKCKQSYQKVNLLT